MKVLFYAASENGLQLSIEKWVRSVIPPVYLRMCRSIPELEGKLRQQSVRCELAILCISAKQEMDHLIRIKNLLEDIRIILIIPDAEKETVQKGHQLYPRFMTDGNMDVNHLATVIRKNLEYLNISLLAVGRENCCAKTLLTKRKKQ